MSEEFAGFIVFIFCRFVACILALILCRSRYLFDSLLGGRQYLLASLDQRHTPFVLTETVLQRRTPALDAADDFCQLLYRLFEAQFAGFIFFSL